jgi:hypothetical protein
MMGLNDPPEEKGLIPRLCDTIFAEVKDRSEQDKAVRFEVECSYMEIYNEKVCRPALFHPDFFLFFFHSRQLCAATFRGDLRTSTVIERLIHKSIICVRD